MVTVCRSYHRDIFSCEHIRIRRFRFHRSTIMSTSSAKR